MNLDGKHAASSMAGLYEGQRNRVFAVCFALLRNVQDAEDATQETFAHVLPRLDTLNGDPTGYLIVTARNVCLDELRRRVRRPETDLGTSPECGSSKVTAEDTAITRDLVGEVWRDLPEGDRHLFAHVFAGWSPREIAAQLGMSANLVNLRIFRARQRIRRLVSAPAAVASVRPRAALDALMQRVRALRSDTAPPLLAQLQTTTLGVVPLLAGIVAGIVGGAAPILGGPSTAPLAEVASGHVDRPVRQPLAVALPIHPLPSSAAASRPNMPPPVYLDSFTPTAHYTQDHVLYAEGPTSQPCQSDPCFSLYRTDNGGRSWRVISPDFVGQLLMPPSFPSTQTLFSLRSDGLARSDDAGRTFKLVNALLLTAQNELNTGTSTPWPVALPTPLQSLAGALQRDAGGAVNTVRGGVQGDVAAMDPTSTADDVRVFILSRATGLLSVYDSASGSVLVDYKFAPYQLDVVNMFTGPGAKGVFIVTQTLPQTQVPAQAPRGVWSTYLCTAQAGCSWLGPAPRPLREFNDTPTYSPTFGGDQTLWYSNWHDISQVTMSGDDTTLSLPAGWEPLALIPDARYATTRTLEVIATGDSSQAQRFAVFASVGGGPLTMVSGRDLPQVLNLQSLQRLPDGSIVGVDWNYGDTPGGMECSRDDARSWHPTC